jgi:5-methylcytosine-specific restriction enzyme subunit McrC
VNTSTSIISLVEYECLSLKQVDLSDREAEHIYHHFGTKVSIEWPSPKTNGKWQLTSLGWVGFIPLGNNRGISLRPKAPLKNLFGMLEYAYDLPSFKLLSGLYECESIRDFYEQLAIIFANRFLDRAREGLYNTYRAEHEELSFVRGRIDFAALCHSPSKATITCSYEDQTIDNDDNQLIAWTLHIILQSGLLSERAIPLVRKADRVLRNSVTLKPFSEIDCIDREYNRLNSEYEVLHKLCRFFLENSGPTQNYGDHSMIPFLINMARLFELFVGRWLQRNIDKTRYHLKRKESLNVDSSGTLKIEMDLVLYNTSTGIPVCVLDTKYKAHDSVRPEDYYQVLAYAENIGCTDAILIYPLALEKPLDVRPRNIRVRGLPFDIGKDIEASGRVLLELVYSTVVKAVI